MVVVLERQNEGKEETKINRIGDSSCHDTVVPSILEAIGKMKDRVRER